MKRNIAKLCALFITLCLLMTGCAGNTPPAQGNGGNTDPTPTGPQTVSAKDTLVVSVEVDPGNYNPNEMQTSQAEKIFMQVMEKLLTFDEQGNVVPCLAESFEYSDDTTLVLHLRKDVTFHNGEPMKASDVLFSLRAYMDTATGSSALSMVDRDNIKADDDYTVTIPLKQVNATVINVLAGRGPCIVPEAAYTAMGSDFALSPIGTGCFKFVSYTSGDSVKMEAYDGYWGESGSIKNLTIRFISEKSQALIELEQGNLDAMEGDLTSVEAALANDSLEVIDYSMPSVQYVGYNHLGTHTSNEKVRQAIACAINREDIVNGAADGFGKVAVSPVASSVWGFDEDLAANDRYPYNVERAKELLKEAGYENGGFEINLLTDTSAFRMLQAQIIKNELAEIGITVNIVSYESATVTSILTSGEGYDMYIRGIVFNTLEPITDLAIATHPANAYVGGSAPTFYSEGEAIEKFGALLDEAVVTIDSEKRAALLKEAQEVFMETLPVLPLYEMKIELCVSNKLKGVGFVGATPLYTKAYFVD